MEFRVVTTKRNGKSLLLDGYKFRFHQTVADKKHWRCDVIGCKSRCHTDMDMTQIVKIPGEHGHAPDEAKNDALCLVAAMKRKLHEDPDQPVKRVYDRVLLEMNGAQNADDVANHFPRFHQVKTTLYRQLWKNRPILPKTRSPIHRHQ
ncbi:hypothetical protein ACOMHN_038148 [Nucella lapillus]